MTTEPVYRLEWRHRSISREGDAIEVTRARSGMEARELPALASSVAHEAIGREFVVTLLTGVDATRHVCVRAEELIAWEPVAGELPRGLLPTYWADDESAGAERYRLLSVIAAAFAEARALRLVGRRESREIMVLVRRSLLRT